MTVHAFEYDTLAIDVHHPVDHFNLTEANPIGYDLYQIACDHILQIHIKLIEVWYFRAPESSIGDLCGKICRIGAGHC